MRRALRLGDIVRGMLIYAAGDSLAVLIQGQFRLTRLLGIMLVGGSVYAFEIPRYFAWIDRCPGCAGGGWRTALKRTALALLYFNPLWIARHVLFIKVFTPAWDQISWALVEIGCKSFVVNIPIAAAANYLIQNRLPLRWRFTGSAVFSSLMAIYYALSAVWFA